MQTQEIVLKMPPDMLILARRLARQRGATVGQLIRDALASEIGQDPRCAQVLSQGKQRAETARRGRWPDTPDAEEAEVIEPFFDPPGLSPSSERGCPTSRQSAPR